MYLKPEHGHCVGKIPHLFWKETRRQYCQLAVGCLIVASCYQKWSSCRAQLHPGVKPGALPELSQAQVLLVLSCVTQQREWLLPAAGLSLTPCLLGGWPHFTELFTRRCQTFVTNLNVEWRRCVLCVSGVYIWSLQLWVWGHL